MDEKRGLCFRCEYRAQYLEKGHAPRFECGQIKETKYGCYMYKPVRPVKLAKNEGDPRPQFAGSMFSARSHISDSDPEVVLDVQEYKDGNMIFWVPDKEDKLIKKPRKKRAKKQTP